MFYNKNICIYKHILSSFWAFYFQPVYYWYSFIMKPADLDLHCYVHSELIKSNRVDKLIHMLGFIQDFKFIASLWM